MAKLPTKPPVTAPTKPDQQTWGYQPLERDFGDVSYHDARLLPDAERGIEIVHMAIEDGKPIFILGDYDNDGITSSHILASAIRDCGGQVTVRIPERIEGYGAKPLHVDEAAAQGAKLLIMIDNGSTAFDALYRARDCKLPVIIVDHHNIQDDDLSKLGVVAFINPKRPNSAYPFPEICSAFLAYKLAGLLYESFGFPKGYHSERFLDTAAIGTIGDMMPLTGENRRLVIDGLRRIELSPNRHTRALKNALMTEASMRSRDVAFSIVPAVNAASRLGDARLAQAFFESQTPVEIGALAAALRSKNEERRALKAEYSDATELKTDPGCPIAIGYKADLPIGLIGLVAADFVNKYKRPALVFCQVDHAGVIQYKASGRSIPGFSLYDYVMGMPEEWFDARGGHDEALGVTVKEAHWQDFLQYVEWNRPDIKPPDKLYYSDILNYVDQQLCIQDEQEPYGEGNPWPVYLVPSFTIEGSPRNLSGTLYGKAVFNDQEIRIKSEYKIEKGRTYRGLATLDRDQNGNPRLTLQAVQHFEGSEAV